MLPTFVIGLREGLEAALIVGIVAAFLRKQGRRDLLRWVFVGVGGAVLLCLGIGIALEVLSKNLPQRQQEGLETVIGALAVCMVTYMVVWMRRHSRELKGQLEGMAAGALAVGSSRAGRAMVAMAFLAVLREGIETVVFLLAAFNESGSGSAAGAGAVLGVAVAIALGYGIYRGGVRLNLSKFFRATGLVLVFVAAGLVVNALHTAHEAGWLDAGQGSTVDLTWLVAPGSVQASLLTGMLGVQGHPVVIEVVGWLVYVVPVGCYVAWPPGRPVPRPVLLRVTLGAAVLAGAVALAFALLAPARPAPRPVTTAGALSAQLVSRDGAAAVIRTQQQSPAASVVGALANVDVRRSGTDQVAGLAVDVYTGKSTGTGARKLHPTLSAAQIADLNGGRLPIGVRAKAGNVPVRYADTNTLTALVEPRTGRVIDVRWREHVTVTIADPVIGTVAVAEPVRDVGVQLPESAVAAATYAAHTAVSRIDRHASFVSTAWVFGVVGAIAALAAGAFRWQTLRRPAQSAPARTPHRDLAAKLG
jgi:high-affinity iron transporter